MKNEGKDFYMLTGNPGFGIIMKIPYKRSINICGFLNFQDFDRRETFTARHFFVLIRNFGVGHDVLCLLGSEIH